MEFLEASPFIRDELRDSIKSNPAIVTEVSSRLVAHGHVTSAFESMSCHTFQS